MKIRLANNNEFEVIATGAAATRVEPSSSPAMRSRMFVYMPEEAMPLADFIGLFTAKENLETVTLTGDAFEKAYRHYSIVQSVGKELVRDVDSATGAVTEQPCLAVCLEQLTYIEQQLAALGVSLTA